MFSINKSPRHRLSQSPLPEPMIGNCFFLESNSIMAEYSSAKHSSTLSITRIVQVTGMLEGSDHICKDNTSTSLNSQINVFRLIFEARLTVKFV